MISGGSMVNQDVPPFTIAQGDRAKTVGLNLVGLKRRGFDEQAISGLKKAYRLIFRSGLRLEIALEQIVNEVGDVPQVVDFVEFVKGSQRGLAR
jgi:UDP-N-acetylglucosamine acyltransferase